MADNKEYRRSMSIAPKTTAQFNQFLPTKDKQSGYVPAPLRKKRSDYTSNEEYRRSWASPQFTEADGSFSRVNTVLSTISQLGTQKSMSAAHIAWSSEYESSDSDADRPDPDLVLDDLASRRFHRPSVVSPTNFALPVTSGESTGMSQTTRPKVTVTYVPQPTLTYLSFESQPPLKATKRSVSAEIYIHEDSEDEDNEISYADPIHDDLYARKVGLKAEPSAIVNYSTFLPKFWTPEDDTRVQSIRRGTQHRTWYKKIQGFSRKKYGSSSDDSDCDVSPQLCVSSRSQSEPPPFHTHTPETSSQSNLSITPSSSTQPLTLTQESSGSPRFEIPDFWPRLDPTSGPRLIKCEKRSLLGREHPNDPYNVPEDILPDLENDDMYARRTSAFHSSAELARLKYGGLFSLHHRSEPCIRVVTQSSHDKSIYPDIERDDVLTRRIQLQSTQRPLSGAPDNFHPVPIPEPWALPKKLQSKICSPIPPIHYEPQFQEEQKTEEPAKTDDMLVRKLRMVHVLEAQNTTRVSAAGSHTGPSVPSSCTEEDLQKWEAIREASRVRHKKRMMVERLLQKDSESDGNTSSSDIPTEEVRKKVNYEELQKLRERVKENEDKWQDDLTKWKNRRKSVNSDIMKKKEERDQIESLSSGNNTRKPKTFKEMEEERGNRESGYKGRYDTFSTSEDVFEEPTPKARTLDRSSFTFDNSYFSGSRSKMHSLPSLADEEPTAGSLPSDEVDSPTRPVQSSTENMLNRSKVNPTISSTSRSLLDDPIPSSVTSKPSLPERSSTIESRNTRTIVSSSTMETNDNSKPLIKDSNSITPVPVPRHFYGRLEEDQTRTSLYKPDSAETKQPVLPRVSASLPKSYQRSDSARITSVVAPRPFGTQSTRISSLPRTYMMEDKRVNGETENTKTTTVPSRYAEFMKEDEASSQTGSVQSSNDDDEEEENQMLSAPGVFSSVTPVGRVSPQTKVFPVDNTQEESYSDMRISLNQKPKSSQDFGFQSNWDSTGAYIKSIKPGSPAELCHLKVGDEILAVNGHKVADMSYDQWKNCMGEALEQGSLLMDVRRYGKNSFPEPLVNTSLDFSSRSAMDSSMKTLNVSSQPANNLTSIGMNGGIRDEPVTLRKKESEPISLKNFKRRSEFFEQGGSENTVSDAPISSPVTPSNRWSWDPEEERRRQEKWQKEQDRQLQEKYKRDQEKLEEEFRKAQEEAAKEGTKQYQEELRKLELEASRQALREEEERKRREEERKRREEKERIEEERRRMEQQKRMEEERKKKEEEDRKQKEEEKRREEEERRRQEAQHRLQSNGVDYANTFPELSYSYRVKSKSTPELDEMERTDIKGVYSRHRGLASWLLEEELRRKKDPHILKQQAASELELERRRLLSAMKYRNPERASSSSLSEGTWMKDNQYKKELTSPAEADRQQIIQDMKKKTSLQTDNSWIRQSSTISSMTKEHVSLPMRRGESLDNLDTNRPSWGSSWTQSSTSSIPDYSRPQSSSFGPSYRGGQAGIYGKPGFHSQDSLRPSLQPTSTFGNASTASDNESSRNRSVSGKKICSFCELPLGKGAAMIIESLGLCFHLQCFKCIQCKRDLGGSENGAEVRIRNKQLFCNSCYMRVKTGQPTAM